MFKPTTIELPENVNQATVEQLPVIDPSIRSILVQHRVDNIRKAFPDFNRADTLRITPDGRNISVMDLSRVFVLRIPDTENRQLIIDRLLQIPNVLFAEPNAMGVPRLVPNDPHFQTRQWNMRNTGQFGGTPGADIKAVTAWGITQGNSNVMIGIVDVGRVQQNHPEFSGRVSGNLTAPISDHATHVAGIAAAKGNNGIGVAGVSWNAPINTQTIGDIPQQAAAVMAAVDAGARIVNNSWGQGSNIFSVVAKQAFVYAYKWNASSINAMSATYSPEDYPNAYGQGIINVAATTNTDNEAPYTVSRNFVDVSAPGGHGSGGTRIYSTISGSTYGYMSGTSMAAPHVAGIASLLKTYNINLFNDDIENIIKLSADKIPGMQGQNWTPEYGYGRVNTHKSLDRLDPRNSLTHAFSLGGTSQGASSMYTMAIYGAQSVGLQDGNYRVKRHEVRKTVTYSPTPNFEVAIWCRGAATNGWAHEGSANYTYGWCEPVPGTVTKTSATLRTYVYEVHNMSNQFIGWYPTTPSNVRYEYTVHGFVPKLAVTISGPTTIHTAGNYTWTANASGGTGSYTYTWYRRVDHIAFDCHIQTNWQHVGSGTTYSSYVHDSSDYDFLLRVDVQSGTQSQSAEIKVHPRNNFYLPCPAFIDGEFIALESINLPTAFAIYDNYPNPFNPSTTISYDIPEPSRVSLIVYDIMGREVQRLVEDIVEPGYHAAVWYGRSTSGSPAASGVYIYRFSAIPLSDESTNEGIRYVKKMLFTK